MSISALDLATRFCQLQQKQFYDIITSGGQILAKKRSIFGTKYSGPGNATTEFELELPIGTLKKRLREATNRIAEDLDEATKEAILVREPQCDQS